MPELEFQIGQHHTAGDFHAGQSKRRRENKLPVTHWSQRYTAKQFNRRKVYLLNDAWRSVTNSLTTSSFRRAELYTMQRKLFSELAVLGFLRRTPTQKYMVVWSHRILLDYAALSKVQGIDQAHGWNRVALPGTVLSFRCAMAQRFMVHALFLTQDAKNDVISQGVHIADGMVPCTNPNCEHPVTLNLSKDRNGWWLHRKCSPGATRRKKLTHDKDGALLLTALRVGSDSVLCLFHGVKAKSENIDLNPRLRLLKGPIMAAWKAVRFGIGRDVFDLRVKAYKKFLRSLPERWYLIFPDDIESHIKYDDRRWFSAPWDITWILEMEISTVVVDGDPQNSLSRVNNGTEALVKKVDKQALFNQVHRTVEPIFRGVTEDFLPSETTKLEKIRLKMEPPTKFYPKEVELDRIKRGLDVQRQGWVHFPEGWQDHGYVVVEYSRASVKEPKSVHRGEEVGAGRSCECGR
jgi:hypothetical protein